MLSMVNVSNIKFVNGVCKSIIHGFFTSLLLQAAGIFVGLPQHTPYTFFVLAATSTLFSHEELGSSHLFTSKKSQKRCWEPKKVVVCMKLNV